MSGVKLEKEKVSSVEISYKEVSFVIPFLYEPELVGITSPINCYDTMGHQMEIA